MVIVQFYLLLLPQINTTELCSLGARHKLQCQVNNDEIQNNLDVPNIALDTVMVLIPLFG